MPVTSRDKVTFLWKWRGTWTQAATQTRPPRSSSGATRGNRPCCSRGKRRPGWRRTAAIKIPRKAKRSVYNQAQIKVSLVSLCKKVYIIKQWPINKFGSWYNAFITRLTRHLSVSVNIGTGGLRRNSSGYYSNSSEQRSNPSTPGATNAAFSAYKLPEFKHVKSKIDTGLYPLSHGYNYDRSFQSNLYVQLIAFFLGLGKKSLNGVPHSQLSKISPQLQKRSEPTPRYK